MKTIRVFSISDQIADLMDIIAHLMGGRTFNDGWEDQIRFFDYEFNTLDECLLLIKRVEFDTSFKFTLI